MIATAERTVHADVDAAEILLSFVAKVEFQEGAKIVRKRRLADDKQGDEDRKTQHPEHKRAQICPRCDCLNISVRYLPLALA